MASYLILTISTIVGAIKNQLSNEKTEPQRNYIIFQRSQLGHGETQFEPRSQISEPVFLIPRVGGFPESTR